MLTVPLTALAALAEEEGGHVNQALSWGMGALTMAILMGLLLAVIAIGGGREHS